MIIHLLDKNEMRKDGNARYICNYAVYPTFEKSTTEIKKVTCKNCKKKIN